MSKTNSELKATAREQLLGNYSVLICVFLLTQLVNIVVNIPFSTMLQQGMTYLVPARVIMGFIGSILVTLVVMLLSCSQSYMYLEVGRDRRPKVSDLLYCCKNRPDRYIGYSLFTLIIYMICMVPGCICMFIDSMTSRGITPLTFVSVALMIIGIIVMIVLALAWSMSVYLLLDHPQMKVMESLRTSRMIMKGFKFRLFKLMFSFIGFVLLGILTLGFGFLWVSPYMNQTLTEFYLELNPEL